MVNAWVEHIRKFARENNKTYGCALSDPACRASYKKPTKNPTQRSERASMGGNDIPAPATRTFKSKQSKEKALMRANDRPAPASASAPVKSLRDRMRIAGNRAESKAYLSNRVADARGKLEQMGMAAEDRNVAVRTFKNKKSNKGASKLGVIRSIGRSAMTVLPYQG